MRLSRAVATALALAVGLAFAPEGAEAQVVETGQWRAIPQVGYTLYDDASPMEDGPVLGLESHYALNENFSVGFTFSMARPTVDGSYYPLVLFQVAADTTLLFEAGQQVTQATYGAVATVGTPVLGDGYLYGQGGLGGYTYWTDPQAMQTIQKIEGQKVHTGLMIPVGGGFSYRLGAQSGIRLEVRDEIMTDFDREVFNPVEEEFQNTCAVSDFCIPEANGQPPEASDTVHNIRLMLGFEFIPGG